MKSMEYMVNEKGERTRVVLSVKEYEELVEAQEKLEDRLAVEALEEDKARMDREEAEFVPWEEVRDKIGSEYGSSGGS